MPTPLELVVMTGGSTSTPEEQMMTGAWQAATLDWIGKARQVDKIQRVVVAVNSPDFAAELQGLIPDAVTSVDCPPFHFGERLRDIVAAHGLQKPFYAGAGSGILFSPQQMQSLAQTIQRGENLLVTNNFYSSDFVAFSPGDAIQRIEPPDTDNDLAWRLGRQADLKTLSLPPSAGSLFDVDTPVDLMIAAFHPDTPEHLRRYLAGLDLDCSPICRALDVLKRPGASVVVAGRVGASARAQLEERIGCRVSSFAEERGMRASGRAARGEVRSILGHFIEEQGPEQLFRVLAASADLVLLDSRVLFSHFGQWPSDADRYRSDLFQHEAISDSMLKRLTRAAAQAEIPVVLGGHSLIAGGLYALIEIVERGGVAGQRNEEADAK